MKFAIALICVAVLAGTAAAAPPAANKGLTPAPVVMDRISAADVTAMMTELGMTTTIETESESGLKFLVVTTAGGARFLFRMLGCQNEANLSGCTNAIASAAIASSGQSYEDINRFNGEAVVTTAVYVAEIRIIVLGRNIVVLGGHSRDLFKGTIYLFLTDVQKFVDGAGSAAKSVAFRRSEIAKLGDAPVSVEAARAKYGPEIGLAIANTGSVSFAIDDPRTR